MHLPRRWTVREELVALTRDLTRGALLGEMLLWSARAEAFDRHLRDLSLRLPESPELPLTEGWVARTLDQINEALGWGISRSTLSRHLEVLVRSGWLESRKNPENPFDQTQQYRPDRRRIAADLAALGFAPEWADAETP